MLIKRQWNETGTATFQHRYGQSWRKTRTSTPRTIQRRTEVRAKCQLYFCIFLIEDRTMPTIWCCLSFLCILAQSHSVNWIFFFFNNTSLMPAVLRDDGFNLPYKQDALSSQLDSWRSMLYCFIAFLKSYPEWPAQRNAIVRLQLGSCEILQVFH